MPPSRKSAQPAVPAAIIPSMLARMPTDKVLSGRSPEQPVFQAVRRSDKRFKVPGCPAVHCDRVAKVGVGIEEGRADPDFRHPGVIFDCSDDPVLDEDIDRGKRELVTQECVTGDLSAGTFSYGAISFI